MIYCLTLLEQMSMACTLYAMENVVPQTFEAYTVFQIYIEFLEIEASILDVGSPSCSRRINYFRHPNRV